MLDSATSEKHWASPFLASELMLRACGFGSCVQLAHPWGKEADEETKSVFMRLEVLVSATSQLLQALLHLSAQTPNQFLTTCDSGDVLVLYASSRPSRHGDFKGLLQISIVSLITGGPQVSIYCFGSMGHGACSLPTCKVAFDVMCSDL